MKEERLVPSADLIYVLRHLRRRIENLESWAHRDENPDPKITQIIGYTKDGDEK